METTKRRKESLNKSKSWIRKMIDKIKSNSISMMFFLFSAWAIWYLYSQICFSTIKCFFQISNLVIVLLLVLYIPIFFKMLNILDSDEDRSRDVAILTRYKLMQDLGLKINKKEIEKELKPNKSLFKRVIKYFKKK